MFLPAVPFDGLAGWRFLQRTYDTQLETFSNNQQLKRDTEYFRENIASIQTAEDLVSDRRLLTVALGAFGLQDDIDNKFFIQKMLEEGTTNADSFANRFSDSRYRDFSEAFGLGPGEIRKNVASFFSEDIISAFETQNFEIAVGQQNDTFRIALTAERLFGEIAESGASEEGKWFEVMGQLPLRRLFETAFNLPAAFSQIDIDQQQKIFAEKSGVIFNTTDPADFANAELQEDLLARYTALTQLNQFNASNSSGAIALTLLSQ